MHFVLLCHTTVYRAGQAGCPALDTDTAASRVFTRQLTVLIHHPLHHGGDVVAGANGKQ